MAGENKNVRGTGSSKLDMWGVLRTPGCFNKTAENLKGHILIRVLHVSRIVCTPSINLGDLDLLVLFFSEAVPEQIAPELWRHTQTKTEITEQKMETCRFRLKKKKKKTICCLQSKEFSSHIWQKKIGTSVRKNAKQLATRGRIGFWVF